MALAIDSGTLDALVAGEIADRTLILFDVPGGPYGFCSGMETITWDEVEYVPYGSLVELSVLTQQSDTSAVTVTAKLRSFKVAGDDEDPVLTPDILASIEDELYHQRPVTIYTMYIDPETRAVLSVETEFMGKIDTIAHEETVGGESVLVGQFESISRDFLRTGYRMRSDADQKVFASTDGSLRHVATAAVQEIHWGRLPPKSAKSGAVGPVVTGDATVTNPWDSR